jgi:hypothetical protein
MVEQRTKEQYFLDALKISAFGLVALPIIGQLMAISLLIKGFNREGSKREGSKSVSIYRNAVFAILLVVLYLTGLGIFLIKYRQALFHS